MDDEEFSARVFNASRPLEKIKLAVQEDRFTVLVRNDKPNLPDEFMQAVPSLPDNFRVETEKLKYPDPRALKQSYELKKVPYGEMGAEFRLYIKGYFRKDGNRIVEFFVVSLRRE